MCFIHVVSLPKSTPEVRTPSLKKINVNHDIWIYILASGRRNITSFETYRRMKEEERRGQAIASSGGRPASQPTVMVCGDLFLKPHELVL